MPSSSKAAAKEEVKRVLEIEENQVSTRPIYPTLRRLVFANVFSAKVNLYRLLLTSYPGPFTRAVRAGREIRGLVRVVRACVKFYWNPGKIVIFGIF